MISDFTCICEHKQSQHKKGNFNYLEESFCYECDSCGDFDHVAYYESQAEKGILHIEWISALKKGKVNG